MKMWNESDIFRNDNDNKSILFKVGIEGLLSTIDLGMDKFF